MTPSAIDTSRSAKRTRGHAIALAMVAALASSPAVARGQDGPAASREPDAQDVAMTPFTDLNLTKEEVSAVLLKAASDPYSSEGTAGCQQIGAAIAELDGALGPDMDVSLTQKDRLSTGRMAKSVVASFIPFRGVLREISGAAEQERTMQAAIYAGAVRRGFLKGLGQQQGCAYPARPAFARLTSAAAAGPNIAQPTRTAGEPVTFVAEPVVQRVPARR